MNEKTLELLCEKLGTTVEYLVPKVQAYGIWSSAVAIPICCLVVAFEIWYSLRLRKKYGDELDWGLEEFEGAVVFVGGLLSILAIVVMLCNISNLIMWATVPELGLLKLIK